MKHTLGWYFVDWVYKKKSRMKFFKFHSPSLEIQGKCWCQKRG